VGGGDKDREVNEAGVDDDVDKLDLNGSDGYSGGGVDEIEGQARVEERSRTLETWNERIVY